MAQRPERVVLAEILRPRGNRGEVLARSQTDIPGRIQSLRTASAQLANGCDVPVEIAAAWRHRELWVLKLAGVDSIAAAERFRGADIWVPLAERGAPPGGEFFRSDLIGCSVTDSATGNDLGIVKGWQQYGGPPLMELASGDREALIPFVPEMCEIDLAAKTITVKLPEGLLDL